MSQHSQHYVQLYPEPTAKSLILKGLSYVAQVVWAVAVVYLVTVILFSF
jgi:hypothetical protein